MIKFLGENTGVNLSIPWFGKGFSDTATWTAKEKKKIEPHQN